MKKSFILLFFFLFVGKAFFAFTSICLEEDPYFSSVLINESDQGLFSGLKVLNEDECEKSDWTFLIYMESSEDLFFWTLQNINSIAAASYSSSVNVLIQLHVSGNIAWRYCIKDGAINFLGDVLLGGDCVGDVFNAARWAFTSYQAKHNGLILWNHGFGILDPKLVEKDDGGFEWEIIPDGPLFECSDGNCPIRAILFNYTTKKYMNNSQMVETLQSIKNDILDGSKLEIFGADCCKMGMLEVGYQIKDCANYLVGSQNCELMDGWNYYGMFNNFNLYISPLDAAKTIVDSYDQYYSEKTKSGVYTLSAMDLSYMDKITKNLDDIIYLCLECLNKNFDSFRELICNARSKCVYICDASYYTDLDSFYTQLILEIDRNKTFYDEDLEKLKALLNDGKNLIKQAVVANAVGNNIKDAKGISIYFPKNRIDDSYPDTIFAQKTKWLSFLNRLL